MPNTYFSLMDSRQASQDGHLKLSADETATTILRGYVAHRVYTADSEGNAPHITAAEDVTAPVGLFYDFLDHVYPHLLTHADGRNLAAHLIGKPCNYVYGRFRAMVGDGLFDGTAPTAGAAIYGDDTSGKLSVDAGSVVVGRVIEVTAVREHDGNVLVCEFDFPV